jgi:hypothetical protein
VKSPAGANKRTGGRKDNCGYFDCLSLSYFAQEDTVFERVKDDRYTANCKNENNGKDKNNGNDNRRFVREDKQRNKQRMG